DKKEFVAGESTKETVKTIARGKPGDFRRTRGDYRVLLPMHTGRGCSGHPAFPSPSFFRGTTFVQSSGISCRENAEPHLNWRSLTVEPVDSRSFAIAAFPIP